MGNCSFSKHNSIHNSFTLDTKLSDFNDEISFIQNRKGDRRKTIAICMSGGGSRAYNASMGFFAALEQLGNVHLNSE